MTAAEDLDFVLPGTWWSLNLQGDTSDVNARIHRLVDQSIGRQDDRARMRQEARTMLADVAARGRSIRADHIYLARSLMGGLPLAATLTISHPGISLPAVGSAEDQGRAMLSMVSGVEPEFMAHPSFAVVRSIDRSAPTSDSEVPRLMANYWMQMADSGNLVVFSFSTPMLDLEEDVVLLFDAIVSTVRVRERVEAQ